MSAISVKVDLKNRRKKRSIRPETSSFYKSSKNKRDYSSIKNFTRYILVVLLIFLIGAILASPLVYLRIYIPAIELRDTVMRTVAYAQSAKDAFDTQDLIVLQQELDHLEDSYSVMKGQYEYFGFFKKIPIASGYYRNGEHVIAAGDLALPLGNELITAALPIADVFGYKTSNGISEELGGQEKIETIIRNLPDISSVLESSSPQIESILTELNEIDEHYIPKEIKGYKLRSYYLAVKDILADGNQTIADIEELLNILPSLAGVPDAKTYMLLFQNDKEIRPTGGFLTAYGFVEINNGILGDIYSEDIYNLDSRIYTYDVAPEVVQKYLHQTEWHLRDSNLYPDLVDSSMKFEEKYQDQYYPKPFDGIIYIDTQFVEYLIEAVGSIELPQYRETITKDNVVYQLELYSEKLFTGDSDRKQFMEDLMGALVDRVLNAGSEQWGGLLDAAWNGLKSKHLLLYMHDERAQALASKYGFTGEIDESWEGDYFHISESNMGGLKSNTFVRSSVVQEVRTDPSGDLVKTVKIHWENPEPNDNWLNGPYTSWIRIYVPKGSELIDGAVNVRTVDESWGETDYNKTVFETFINVPTAESEDSGPGVYDVEFSYRVPNVVNEGVYSLKIQKQPGKRAEDYTILINGEGGVIELNQDVELEWEL